MATTVSPIVEPENYTASWTGTEPSFWKREALPSRLESRNQALQQPDRNLVYDVHKFEKFLWKEFKEIETTASEIEWEGTKKHEAFNCFAEEMFHRMYSYKERKLDTPVEGAKWAEFLHSEIGSLPEFQRLKARCKGKDWWAGCAATAMLKTILENKLIDTKEQVKDLGSKEEDKEILEKIKESSEKKETKEEIQKQIDKIEKEIKEIKETDQNLTDKIDKTKVRSAIRTAFTKTEEQLNVLDSAQDLMNSFSGEKQTGKQQLNKELLGKLTNSYRFRHIIDLLGRMERLASYSQREKAKKGTNEITDISSGDNISRMLPSELMNLADPETELLFMSKYHEKSLLEYDITEQPVLNKGPIIVLLDNSGSMAVERIEWALSVTLAIGSIAFKQKRSFIVLTFNKTVSNEYVFSKDSKANQELLVKLLKTQAGGGTDFQEPLMKAVFLIQEEKEFKQADIVMVTDGQARVDSLWIKNYQEHKRLLEFRTMSILIGGTTRESVNTQFSDLIVSIKDLTDDKEIKSIFERI